MMRRLWIVLAAAGTLAACSSPAATTTPARTSAPATTRAAVTTPSPSPTPTPTPTPAGVTVTTVRLKDGSRVTVARFSGPVTYVLHDGSEDPGLAAGRVKAGPAVRGAERRRLLAAFNGGFKLSAGAGGYEQEGHVAAALRRGLASLVIDRSGRARIGVWGHGVPAAGEAVYSVRQNLTPLVLSGKLTPAAADWSVWGATLGGGEFVARSALGQDAEGDLEYAASMSASPADLATALARAGAQVAMELDINPEWVQLDVSRRPGGPLRVAIPGQNRPANQFLDGWARDFIAVLG
ncbi:MAG: hypothetical protein ABSB59_05485 [Streptosporangiaceae bacterium]